MKYLLIIMLAFLVISSLSLVLGVNATNVTIKTNSTIKTNMTNLTLASTQNASNNTLFNNQTNTEGLKSKWGAPQVFLALAVILIAWILIAVLTRAITIYIGILFFILLLLITLVSLLITNTI